MSSPSMTRIVGLSRKQPASPLLMSLPRNRGSSGRSPGTRTGTSTAAATASATKGPKFKEPVPYDAPPLSTDDESRSSGDEASHKSGKPSTDPELDSSEDERPPRGDIRSTNFQSSSSSSLKPNVRKYQQTKSREQVSSRTEQTTRSNKKRKISNGIDHGGPSRPVQVQEDPHKNALGFTKMLSIKMKYRPREKPNARHDKKDDDDENDDDELSDPRPNFKGVPAHSSPVKAASFIHPGSDLNSSPTKEAKRLKTHALSNSELSDEDSALPKKSKFKKQSPTKRPPKKKANIFIPAKENKKKPLKAAIPEPVSRSSSPLSPPAKRLVIPASFSQFKTSTTNLPHFGDDLDLDLDGSDSDALSEVPSDISTLSIQDLLDQEVQATASCPWCGASVDKQLLQDFAKGKRLNVRMQTKFCRSHKKTTALQTWEEKRYPTVEWEELEARFAEHRELLLGIIDGGRESHYRSLHAAKIEMGRARSMKKEDNLNPGYYGPRGFNVMCDYLVGEFGDLLKEKAVSDRVIAGRGSAAFIQSVLVAELAVELIKQDMGVSADAAREILEESKALGEIVHEE